MTSTSSSRETSRDTGQVCDAPSSAVDTMPSTTMTPRMGGRLQEEFRSHRGRLGDLRHVARIVLERDEFPTPPLVVFGIDRVEAEDRKSTRLNSSHSSISYAVFCLKKKKTASEQTLKTTRNQAHGSGV